MGGNTQSRPSRRNSRHARVLAALADPLNPVSPALHFFLRACLLRARSGARERGGWSSWVCVCVCVVCVWCACACACACACVFAPMHIHHTFIHRIMDRVYLHARIYACMHANKHAYIHAGTLTCIGSKKLSWKPAGALQVSRTKSRPHFSNSLNPCVFQCLHTSAVSRPLCRMLAIVGACKLCADKTPHPPVLYFCGRKSKV